MDDKPISLGESIRNARIKKGYTQEYLAELLGITPGHLQHMESERRKPSVPMLFQMMTLLEFSVDALVFSAPDTPRLLDISGLPEEQASAIEHLVETMKKER